jgi:xanthine dehydrogenase accessory factor
VNTPWCEAIAQVSKAGNAYALITVLGVAGSTPRESGAKMVVTADESFDSIGGGQMEYLLVQKVRARLADGQFGQEVIAMPLGAQAKQCCGGHVSVLLETFAPTVWQVAVFGAGHVAQELIPILQRLPLKLHWFDARADYLDQARQTTGVAPQLLVDTAAQVQALPSNTDIILLTHDHGLDFELAQHCLTRGDLNYVGCIGSKTKSQRFAHRLKKAGFSDAELEAWVCPIGLPEISGKLPVEVAISIAGQLIARRNAQPKARLDKRGLHWRDVHQAIAKSTESQSLAPPVERSLHD